MRKQKTASVCLLHCDMRKEVFLCPQTNGQAPEELTLSLITLSFSNSLGSSRSGHIVTPGNAWEQLFSQVHDYCLHAFYCSYEKCESRSPTQQLGDWEEQVIIYSITTIVIIERLIDHMSLKLPSTVSNHLNWTERQDI